MDWFNAMNEPEQIPEHLANTCPDKPGMLLLALR
jgi:hypothetical protein